MLEWVAISFSRGVFPAQGLNPWLLPPLRHCRWFLYRLSHQGSLRVPFVPSQNVCVLGLVSWESGLGGENFTVPMQTVAHSPHTRPHTHTVTCRF